MSRPRPMDGEQLVPRRRKPMSRREVANCVERGYRVTEWVSTKGRTFVNLVTPASGMKRGAPRTREVRS